MKTCLAWVGALAIVLVVGVFALSTCIRLAALETELEPQVVHDYSTTSATPTSGLRDSGGTLGPSISSDSGSSQLGRTSEEYLQREVSTDDFGLLELRSAFKTLPASFEETDSTGLSLWLEEFGWEDDFSGPVVFLNEDPFELIMVASGQISEFEVIVFDKEMSSTDMSEYVELGFLYGANASGENIEIHDIGVLPSLTVGASSFGASFEVTIEGARLKIDFIMFRRENLVGAVYVYIPSDTQPVVSVEEAARMLDLKMSETILARYGER